MSTPELPTGEQPYSPGSIQDLLIKRVEERRDGAVLGHLLRYGPGKHMDTALFLYLKYYGKTKDVLTKYALGVVEPESEDVAHALHELESAVAEYLDQRDPRWEKLRYLTRNAEEDWAPLKRAIARSLIQAVRGLELALADTGSIPYSYVAPSGVYNLEPYNLLFMADGKELGEKLKTPREIMENVRLILRDVTQDFIGRTFVLCNSERSDIAQAAVESFRINVYSGLEGYSTEERQTIAHALYSLMDASKGQDHLDLFLDHFPALTWGSMLELGTLMEEYNLEWALASFEWNPHGYGYLPLENEPRQSESSNYCTPSSTTSAYSESKGEKA